jgi:hypothetical protein
MVSTAFGIENLQLGSVSVDGLTSDAKTVMELRGKGFDESLKLILPVAWATGTGIV